MSGICSGAPIPNCSTCTNDSQCNDGKACTTDTCSATGTCVHTPKPVGTSCADGLFCNGNESCNANGECQPAAPVNCSANNLSAINTCTNIPDGNNSTFDFRPGFTSVCSEITASCTTGSEAITHTCNTASCGAQCDATHPCPQTACDHLDGCVGPNYHDYNNVNNSCLGNCACTNNACGAPTIIPNDPRCGSNPVCHTIDFDGNGSENFLPGTQITNQYLNNNGLTISAINANASVSHPDKAIIFNSSAPTGDDFDLGTPNQAYGGPGKGTGPGAGAGNTTPQGKLLIISENNVDANGDGRIDVPDDEASGGDIYFQFQADKKIKEVTLVDIDYNEQDASVTLYDANNTQVYYKAMFGLGDNSVQIQPDQTVPAARKMKIHFQQSGAVARILYCDQ